MDATRHDAAAGDAAASVTLICPRCRGSLTAPAGWAGREVACPHCERALRVPAAAADALSADGAAGGVAGGASGAVMAAELAGAGPRVRFNFGCPRCHTLLEAHSGQSGQPGNCPTCAARLVIPPLDPQTRLPGAVQLLDEGPGDPTPLHAYAASGEQAPRIRRGPDGALDIECPRCNARSPIESDACRACGAPFTIDAAATTTSYRMESLGLVALALGIISLPLFPLVVPALLAVVLGGVSLRGGGHRSRVGLVGLILGLVSLATMVTMALVYW